MRFVDVLDNAGLYHHIDIRTDFFRDAHLRGTTSSPCRVRLRDRATQVTRSKEVRLARCGVRMAMRCPKPSGMMRLIELEPNVVGAQLDSTLGMKGSKVVEQNLVALVVGRATVDRLHSLIAINAVPLPFFGARTRPPTRSPVRRLNRRICDGET